MKGERITIQDIANSLELSRNTVSKALNGQYVPPRTREKVFNAAIELGYKSYRMIADSKGDATGKRIVLVTSKMLMTMNYFIHIIHGIESALADEPNVELLQFTTTRASFFEKLVDYLRANRVDGIICAEFFGADYISRLVALGYPVVFFDFPFNDPSLTGNYDVVLPESFRIVKQLCTTLINERGCKTFGFIGDYKHCTSFYERFLGMREAMFLANLPYDPRLSVLEKDSFPYGNPEEIARVLQKTPALPSCFIAANDTIAVALTKALKILKMKIPRDVLVVGYDNIPEAKTCDPPLTTIAVDKSELGRKLFSVLLERIDSPNKKTQFIYVQAKPVLRQTT